MVEKGRLTKAATFLGLLSLFVIGGFAIVQTIQGTFKIKMTIYIILILFGIYGLFNLVMKTREKSLSIEDLVTTALLIGIPFVALLYLPKLGLFATINPLQQATPLINDFLNTPFGAFIKTYQGWIILGAIIFTVFGDKIKKWRKTTF